MSEFVIVIPSRYASERLPGKPLREIGGKPMLQHVHERGIESGAVEVVIATDDDRIAEMAESFGAKVCMTSAEHKSGTDRLAEVAFAKGWADEKVIVNLQGDEPLMPAQLIDQCAALLDEERADVATLASPLRSKRDFDNPNVVKVVIDDDGFAMYFSRAAIPFSRSGETDDLAKSSALHHHGIYAYRNNVLQKIVAAEQSKLEIAEQLEQLRALSLGLKIKVGIPDVRPGPGVDTEDDLREAEKQLVNHK
ncbi:MAG: 3-deoxy-manno-octulosonate cytidylyltransferase [Woeseia sp.]|jgi:3-deoxy-manno-octulosonate cytidylyltransferase (CMP-KDO synthetase)|nr:3-deoxy-manno-octulosonate cytidylyltransferase [Woeseia sp.]MBT6211634.1 3-deoxy-manno-octulosonate cytidylyltransferase [Woeseia sp.]